MALPSVRMIRLSEMGAPGGRRALHDDLGRGARAVDMGPERVDRDDRLDVEAAELAGQPGVRLGLERRSAGSRRCRRRGPRRTPGRPPAAGLPSMRRVGERRVVSLVIDCGEGGLPPSAQPPTNRASTSEAADERRQRRRGPAASGMLRLPRAAAASPGRELGSLGRGSGPGGGDGRDHGDRRLRRVALGRGRLARREGVLVDDRLDSRRRCRAASR